MADAHLRWAIGDVTITRVEEVVTYVDADVLMPDFEPAMLDEHRDWLTPHFFSDRNDKMALSIHSFVVESQGLTIVVDTCVGEGDQPLPNDPDFPDRLASVIEGGLSSVDAESCAQDRVEPQFAVRNILSSNYTFAGAARTVGLRRVHRPTKHVFDCE